MRGRGVLVAFPMLVAPQRAQESPERPGPALRPEGLGSPFPRRHFVALFRSPRGAPQDGGSPPFFFSFDKNSFNFLNPSTSGNNLQQKPFVWCVPD